MSVTTRTLALRAMFALSALTLGSGVALGAVDPDLIVYEPFDYTVAPTPGPNFLQNQGFTSDFGFRSTSGAGRAWNSLGSTAAATPASTSIPRLVRGSLAYPASTSSATPRGNSIFNQFEQTPLQLDRHLAQSIGDSKGPGKYYMAFLTQTIFPRSTTSIRLGTDDDAASLSNAVSAGAFPAPSTGTSASFQMGFFGNANAAGPSYANGTFGFQTGSTITPAIGTGVAVPHNSPSFLLAEMTFDGTSNATGDNVKVYLNPNSTPGSGTLIANVNTQLGTFNEMRVNLTNPSSIDEIRIGRTWASMFSNELGGAMTPQPVGPTSGPGIVIARVTKDASLGTENGVGSNSGGTAALVVRDRSNNITSRAAIQFQPLNTLIPSGATITSARLIMEKVHDVMTDNLNPGSFDNPQLGNSAASFGSSPVRYDDHLKVWRIGESWEEGDGVSNFVTDGASGTHRDLSPSTLWSSGDGGTIYDKTGQLVWPNAGPYPTGTLAPTNFKQASRDNLNPYAIANVFNGKDAQTYDLDVTQLVQEWWAYQETGGTSGYEDFGLMLTAFNEVTGPTGLNFMSKEAPGAYANGIEPHLIINYVPEPSSFALSGIGFLGIAWLIWNRRWRKS